MIIVFSMGMLGVRSDFAYMISGSNIVIESPTILRLAAKMKGVITFIEIRLIK